MLVIGRTVQRPPPRPPDPAAPTPGSPDGTDGHTSSPTARGNESAATPYLASDGPEARSGCRDDRPRPRRCDCRRSVAQRRRVSPASTATAAASPEDLRRARRGELQGAEAEAEPAAAPFRPGLPRVFGKTGRSRRAPAAPDEDRDGASGRRRAPAPHPPRPAVRHEARRPAARGFAADPEARGRSLPAEVLHPRPEDGRPDDAVAAVAQAAPSSFASLLRARITRRRAAGS